MPRLGSRVTDQVTLHRLDDTDIEAVQMALYTALAWNNDPNIPNLETVMEHPEVGPYHQDWGRYGDIGVKALAGDLLVGAAFARLFTAEQHGYGFVDEQTPELGIGVLDGRRGHGIGRRLMDELAEAARAEGFLHLSLSVNNPNPSKHLYVSLGYTLVADDGNSSVMVLAL